MPDYWSVPLATNTIDDLDSTIAKGPDLSFIGTLADNYFKGKDQQFTQNQRDAFKGGLPKDANGNIDWSQVSQQLAKVGGTGAVPNIISLQNYGIARDAINSLGNNAGGIFGGTQPIAPPSSATSIPNNAPRAPTPSNAPQPAVSADVPAGTRMPPGQNLTGPGTSITGIDVQNAPIMTPRAIAQRTGGDPGAIAAKLGVGIDQTVDTGDPNVRAQLVQVARNQAPQSVPAPVPAAAPVAAPPVAPAAVSGSPSEAQAQAFEQRANNAFRMGTALSFSNPAAGSRLQALGEALMKQAQTIREGLVKNSELTPEQKNAAASGSSSPVAFAQDQSRATEAGKSYQKLYESINKAGTEAAVEKPQLDLIKSMFNDPNFYSGPAENVNLAYKRILAQLGGNPNVAEPQEAFRKIISNSILSNIRSMAGTGQIRVAEIKIMERAAANPDNSVASNRLLVNIASRLYDRAQAVDQLARSYNGGRLDSGFDTVLRNYDQQHPLFTTQELRDPRLISPPTFQSPQAVMNAGLPRGTPFQTPDGRIKYVP